ncbi:MAG: hypothetical protein EOO27_35850 [Comamonadaceae bacterium]|nr:MAG: hypothetical protein EOO27_35850 [Comamonadaceae bacterium]
MLDAAIRLQRGRNRMIGYQDSQTLLRRVTDSVDSFHDAFAKLDNLTSGFLAVNCPPDGTNPDGTTRFVPCWEAPGGIGYSPSKVSSEALPLPGPSVPVGQNLRVHRYLVWYNRRGCMMLAHMFLPGGYPFTQYATIVSVHPGGWRGGFIEKNQKYNTSFIQASNGYGPFVVFAPAYALSAYQHIAPMSQDDIEDFRGLVASSATQTQFAVNTSVHGFGVSAGGHLLNLLALTRNYGRVGSAGPVSDLRDGFNGHPNPYGNDNAAPNPYGISTPPYAVPNVTDPNNLLPFINRYTNMNGMTNPQLGAVDKGSVSPNAQPSSVSGSQFYIQHGVRDTLVSPKQSKLFQSNNASTTGVCGVDGYHAFYDPYASTVELTQFDAVVARFMQFFATGTKSTTGCKSMSEF